MNAVRNALPDLSDQSIQGVATSLNLAKTGYTDVTSAVALKSSGQAVVVDVQEHNFVGAVTDVAAGAANVASAETDGSTSDDLGALQNEAGVIRLPENQEEYRVSSTNSSSKAQLDGEKALASTRHYQLHLDLSSNLGRP